MSRSFKMKENENALFKLITIGSALVASLTAVDGCRSGSGVWLCGFGHCGCRQKVAGSVLTVGPWSMALNLKFLLSLSDAACAVRSQSRYLTLFIWVMNMHVSFAKRTTIGSNAN